ncbi:hypothetical protein PILCRDRAFT_256054 [Piloderma croceum F 1598]|uniref:NACHT domain-containing protein n=1 Tax=Piloderma croceum (strain F 1598) TaxID=765440 RepID=A0A0C3FVD0_PILCF|nr:hypothetical protein PILCRDRAFT_256054 [Piloderma croceum F 1598]
MADFYRLLAPANAGCDRNGPIARCLDGTRQVLIARIKRWIDTDPALPICWLHGPAGSGKSAVAQTIGEYCQSRKRLAASFFFFRGAENRSTIAPLVSTLAYQLSISVPATKPLLQNLLGTDPSISQRALSHQFKKLMLEPILEMENPPRAPTVVIIDALDECGDKELMAEFLEVVIDACRANHAFPFRVLLTSRVEYHLRRRLEGHAAQSIVYLLDLQNFDASNDIRKFFQSRFSTIYGENQWCMREISWPWPLNSEVDTLVNWASGSFLRAAEFTNLFNDGTNAPHQTLRVALRAITNPQRRISLSRLVEVVRQFLRSPSGQTAISESSSYAVGSAPISSMSPTLSENRGVSGIIGRGETEHLFRAKIGSGASMLSNIPDLQQVSQAQSGPIELVSLESLIENLITDFSSANEYWDIFFATYTVFATADDVLKSLVRRFGDSNVANPQNHTGLRMTIITFMKHWVRGTYFEVDANALAQIKQFAMSIRGSDTMTKLAEELHSAATKRPISLPLSHAKILQGCIKPTKPRDLAIAFLILARDKLTHIRPSDYISYFKNQPGHNKVKAAREINDIIVNWVKRAVVSAKDLDARSSVLKFLIYTAEESRKLRNFASMTAIVTALRSITITRLELTYNQLPSILKQMIKEMEALLDPCDNHRAYVATLRNSRNLPCIPFLVAYVDYMRTVFPQENYVVNTNGVRTINFSKWTEFYTCIRAVIQHEPPDVSRYRQRYAGMVAWLEDQLCSSSVGPTTDEYLESLSVQLRRDEQRQYRWIY